MLLSESKLTEVLTEGLQYHLDTKTPLYENVYRPGSESYFTTIKQARHLLNKGILSELCLEDMELLFETQVGEYGEFEGKRVPLDFPMINEIALIIPSPAASWREASQEPLVTKMGEDGWLSIAGKSKASGGLGYKAKYSDIKTFLGQLGTPDVTFSDSDEVQMPTILKYMEGERVNYKVVSGASILASLVQEDPDPDIWVVDITDETEETIAEYVGYEPDYFATWFRVLKNIVSKSEVQVQRYIKDLSDPAKQAANYFIKFLEDNPGMKEKLRNSMGLYEGKLGSDQKKELVRRLLRAAMKNAPEKNIARIIDDIEAKLTSSAVATGAKYVDGVRVNEAKYQGKEVKLNKPKRGGSKKFFVYTKNPKTGKVVKVSFGGTTGLKAKINNAEARKSFAARHNCATKKDKTKSGYWSCRLPRYASLLGLKSSFGGYW